MTYSIPFILNGSRVRPILQQSALAGLVSLLKLVCARARTDRQANFKKQKLNPFS